MKKEYMNPTMRVVVIKHRSQLLAGSGRSRSVRGVSSADDDFIFVDGIDGEDM